MCGSNRLTFLRKYGGAERYRCRACGHDTTGLPPGSGRGCHNRSWYAEPPDRLCSSCNFCIAWRAWVARLEAEEAGKDKEAVEAAVQVELAPTPETKEAARKAAKEEAARKAAANLRYLMRPSTRFY